MKKKPVDIATGDIVRACSGRLYVVLSAIESYMGSQTVVYFVCCPLQNYGGEFKKTTILEIDSDHEVEVTGHEDHTFEVIKFQ